MRAFPVHRSAGTTEERGCALDSPLENSPISVSVSAICLHLYDHSFIHSFIQQMSTYMRKIIVGGLDARHANKKSK